MNHAGRSSSDIALTHQLPDAPPTLSHAMAAGVYSVTTFSFMPVRWALHQLDTSFTFAFPAPEAGFSSTCLQPPVCSVCY